MDSFQQDQEITPEEREQVLQQIETVIAESRTPQTPDVLRAEKRGLAFPLLINAAAVVLIALGVFLFMRYFELRKENITLRRGPYLSAEGTFLQTMKRETENRLQAKEREIASIQSRLDQVDQERQALKLELEAELQTREEQLRQELEQELDRERDRLAALGTSEARIVDRLRELETRQQGTIDRRIAAYRRQLDEQLREKARELIESREQSREALAQATRDRNELSSELERQESEKNAAEMRLSELNARMQAETLLKQQAAAMFANLQEHLRNRRDAAALQDLESLADNPVVEPYLVDLLRELIQVRQEAGAEGTESAAVDALEAELAAKSGRIEELEEQIRTIVAAGDSRLGRQLQARVDSLNAQLAAGKAEAERLAVATRDLQAERDALALTLRDVRAERDAASLTLQNAREAQSDAQEQGRDDALRDVLTYLRYLSESGDAGGDTEAQLRSLAREDPLFRAANREIRILIAGGVSGGGPASPYAFLGIVSSVASGRAVIEAMVDLEVSTGSVIQIRRISELDREIPIAEGTVLQVRGGKITASFKTIDADARDPAARDPVYVVLPEK